jgi:hypothetical protein
MYTEADAAETLGIRLSELHLLLDEHVFNDGSPRPQELTFQESDLVLLSFWKRSRANAKVLRMPRRS